MNEDKKTTSANKANQRRSREEDASAAMAEYKASKVADQTKTARLRALRLAKEAAAGAEPEKAEPKRKLAKPHPVSNEDK